MNLRVINYCSVAQLQEKCLPSDAMAFNLLTSTDSIILLFILLKVPKQQNVKTKKINFATPKKQLVKFQPL